MKYALMDVDHGLLDRIVNILNSAAIRIVGSAVGESYSNDVRLVIEGEALPECCAREWWLVDATVQTIIINGCMVHQIKEIHAKREVKFDHAGLLPMSAYHGVIR